MSLFTRSRVGHIVKISGGILAGKYGMIAKEFSKTTEREEGFSIMVEPSDWPSEVPSSFNAIFVLAERVTDCSEEEEVLLRIKFPKPGQFE